MSPGAPRASHAAAEIFGARLANEADEPDIERFVAAHPEASLYHRPAILRAIRRAAGLATATVLVERRVDGRLAGVLPVALTQSRLFGTYATSMPFFNYGGALVDDPAAARPLVARAWAWARRRGARHLVLRHTEARPLELPATRAKEGALLAIPPGGPDALWKKIGSKTRNLVRKAEKVPQEASVAGAEAIPAFHRVYAENLRDLGTPSLPERFFHVLFEELGEHARVHLVRRGEAVTAASVTLRFRDRVEVPWAASSRQHRDLAGNMLCYWSMLAAAARGGAAVFDFGRSTPGSGPHRFKLQWGARTEPLPWYFVARDPAARPGGELAPTNPKYALAIGLWKRLPVPIARTVGGHIALSLP